MSRLVAAEYLTLDGVMEDPTWARPYCNEELGEFQHELLAGSDALLLGRRTHESCGAAWPQLPAGPGAERLRRLPRYVASRTLPTAGPNAQLLRGEVAAAVARLKQQPGHNLLLYGSGQLVEYLRRHGLVDEYRLMVCPTVQGCGQRLFAGGLTDFRLLSSHTTRMGVLLLRYQATLP